MKKICPYCNQELEFEKYQQFGGHITNCKMNPNKIIINNKAKKTRRNNIYNLYKLKCIFCNKQYELEITKNNYIKRKYKKCCCKICSSKYSQSFLNSDKLKDSNCVDCGKEIKIKIQDGYSLCEECGSCKTKKGRNINKVKNGHIKNRIYLNGKNLCKYCGDEICILPNICKTYYKGRYKIFEKIGFDPNKIGTKNFYKEYYRIVDILEEEYIKNSLTEIGEKYKINYQTLHTLFKSLNIKRRNISDAIKLALKKGRYKISNTHSYPYKSGYHITWEDKIFWYRSSYELDFCKELDEKKISYEMENLRIEYFDTQKNEKRIAVPDFYLIDNNEIIEIKSTWTYDEQNMKDKIKAYNDLGYNYKLILEHKELQL
jgi:hypothetical protein